ncbi:3-hydroxy-acyl-CoA dehydrogenase [Mycena sanguinolenta]|uniref:3-hydroxy-acyl-CoA dehydrogenase n=1 Tax=Mycena sanguinolenta TaxID=230812 RepID=A0A8H7DG83_9AGAR|nr:3-hydroxy-acyl-CoA dehydrogenase [Mycena sanguinolenta]
MRSALKLIPSSSTRTNEGGEQDIRRVRRVGESFSRVDSDFSHEHSSSGLGLAAVKDLVDADARVVILDRADPQETFETERVLFIRVDITHHDDVALAVKDAVAWTERTGAFLGGMIDGRGKPHSIEGWQRHVDINLTGAFNLTRLVLQRLIRVPPEDDDGERGVVILVSSTAAYEGMPSTIAYAATKGAIRSITLPMARDLSRYGVRVVTIAPGPFVTPLTGQWTPKVTNGMTQNGLLFPQRYGKPKEFAQAVRFVLSCAYINGGDDQGDWRWPAARASMIPRSCVFITNKLFFCFT